MNRTKKILPLILLAIFMSCNQGEQKEPQAQDEQQQEETGQGQTLKRSVALAPTTTVIDSTTITPSGDTIIYKHSTKIGTYTYDQPEIEVRLKGTVTPTNRPPVASAGQDQSMTLPTNKAALNATGSTDPDNNISTYSWRKLSGPFSNIANQDQPIATISDLVAGVYSYEVRVTDAGGLFSTDVVTVTVKGQVDPPTGTTRTFNGSIIPVSETDLVAPGRAAEQWHDRNDVRVPSEGAPAVPLDRYQRFVATRIAGSAKGQYNWSFFDNLVREAINKDQKLSFGYMTVYADGNTSHGLVQFPDGGLASYPLWVHNLMMANSNTSLRPWKYGNAWIPNYNSQAYSDWLLEFNTAINQHIYSTTIDGVPMKNVVSVIDIRGVGNWGEWHHYPYVGEYPNKLPPGRMPTFESLKRIVDAHLKGFPNNPLVAMISAHDRERLVNTWNPPAISDYLATARNNWGGVGYRNDHWGGLDTYTWDYLDHPALANVWKAGYITGEPPGSVNGTNNMADLVRQLTKYRVAMIGNGNMGGGESNTTVKNNFRAASKASGYRLQISKGSITSGTAGSVSITWQNVGIAPTYENWNTVFELKNGSAVVWTGTSKFKPTLFLPGTSTVVDNFDIPVGNYTLTVKLVDPSGYRKPILLAQRNRNGDGSYTLIN